jgi:hypothetical protein
MVRVDRWYTSRQFIANNWQWLWAVVVVPVAGLLWLKERRRAAERDSDDPGRIIAPSALSTLPSSSWAAG